MAGAAVHNTSKPATSVSTALSSAVSEAALSNQARCWRAGLRAELACVEGSTVLKHLSHHGPLRVQRPFYPRSKKECHLYLLHPPGGLVSGDVLHIDVSLGQGSHTVLTTPSAGKIYAGDRSADPQRQRVHCQVSDAAVLEWLPQETIVFDGSRGILDTHIELTGAANFCAWDIVCLGRPASDERFSKGYLRQRFGVYRDSKPLYLEQNHIEAGSVMLSGHWGLKNQPVIGTMITSCHVSPEQVDSWYACLASDKERQHMSITRFDEGLVVARYIGASAAQCRAQFSLLWQQLRPLFAGVTADAPRIWNT